LEHCPEKSCGYFNYSGNQLTSLEHCPKEVCGDVFDCSDNYINTLEDLPKLPKIAGVFLTFNY